MNIALGADHAGWKLKEGVKKVLEQNGHKVIDKGTHGEESVDYPDYAEGVARAVAQGECDRGILFCGTGIGMSITANKIKGIRAAVCHDAFTAEMSRKHNDANVFCAGARVLDPDVAKQLVLLWLQVPFEGGRHQRRVDKIHKLD